jgi:hypothetical protein
MKLKSLKKLSRQGRILVLIIAKQALTYELKKHSKAGGKLWSSTAASMFDINLKRICSL